jgi:hypothetical protein
MAIQVTDSFNQLRIENGSKVEYYKYATIKSLSAVSDADSNFSVVINFITDDKNNPLVLKLDNIDNQPTWVDNALGVNVAIEAISDWMHTDNPSTNVTVEGWTAPLGQEPMASSIPVVLSSDQSSIPVDARILNPTGQDVMANSIPIVIASDQAGVQRQTNMLRNSLNSFIGPGIYSASFANVHASGDVSITAGNGVTAVLKPGETISFDPGAINNTLDRITYDATAAEVLIIFIS